MSTVDMYILLCILSSHVFKGCLVCAKHLCVIFIYQNLAL